MKFRLLSSVLIFSSVLLLSCKKTKDTTATITVIDTNGLPVGGAFVELEGQSSPDAVKVANPALRKVSFTPANGVVSFNYTEIYKAGQAGVAVINVSAYKLENGDTTAVGKTYVKLDPETDNAQTVVLKANS